jgi:hypothetical protein
MWTKRANFLEIAGSKTGYGVYGQEQRTLLSYLQTNDRYLRFEIHKLRYWVQRLANLFYVWQILLYLYIK